MTNTQRYEDEGMAQVYNRKKQGRYAYLVQNDPQSRRLMSGFDSRNLPCGQILVFKIGKIASFYGVALDAKIMP